MKLDTLLISFLVCLLFLIGGTAIIAEQADTYDYNSSDPLFSNATKNFQSVYNVTDDMKGIVDGEDVSEGDALDLLIGGAFNAIKLIWGSFGAILNLMTAIGKGIGIPGIIMSILFVILTIAVLFSIIYMMVRFQPR